MRTTTPKFRNQGEARCWTANQAAALNRFNWPAKKKVNLDYLSKLTSQIADKSLLQYRKRVKS